MEHDLGEGVTSRTVLGFRLPVPAGDEDEAIAVQAQGVVRIESYWLVCAVDRE